jgi:hypothetical protein
MQEVNNYFQVVFLIQSSDYTEEYFILFSVPSVHISVIRVPNCMKSFGIATR